MKKIILGNLNQSGYVALLSTIIIGAVLLIMTIEAGQSGWYTRFIVLGREAKQQSRNLANSCTREAFSRSMTDLTFVGKATTTTLIGSCYVFNIQKNYPLPGHLTFRIQANVRSSITNLVSEYDMQAFHIATLPLDVPVVPLTNIVSVEPLLILQTEVATMP